MIEKISAIFVLICLALFLLVVISGRWDLFKFLFKMGNE